MNYKQHTNCRVCGSDQLTPYLDLGNMPLSNNLATSPYDTVHYQRYPLKVLLCSGCGLSQLSIVIPAETMFSHYVYRSSISEGYKDHCRKMAIELQAKHNLNSNSLHVDIAGNDGALLEQFKKVIGHKVINIDPAENLKAICEATGITCFTEFWGMVAARRIVNSFGKCDLITATNVFAHVDNVKEFIEAAKYALKPQTGVLVLEFPYLVDFIERSEFDTVYFEHLSYFTIYPLALLCQEVGLVILEVSKQDIHGGSVRVTIGDSCYWEPGRSVTWYIENEKTNYHSLDPYYQFAEDVKKITDNLSRKLYDLQADICGFAASAKGNTLLNAAGITPAQLRYIVDETPEKIGKYSPGTFLPIVAMVDMLRTPPDYLLILSWNFADEIIRKCKAAGYRGKFILPLTFEIIE